MFLNIKKKDLERKCEEILPCGRCGGRSAPKISVKYFWKKIPKFLNEQNLFRLNYPFVTQFEGSKEYGRHSITVHCDEDFDFLLL